MKKTPSLNDQLYEESEYMARYALSNGYAVPPKLLSRLERLLTQHVKSTDLLPEDKSILETDDGISVIHQRLVTIIEPATPSSITLLGKEAESPSLLYMLGSVPLVRSLSVVTLFFLFSLILVSLSPQVNVQGVNAGFLDSEGLVLLLNRLFLLCCSGIGACFSGLHRVNRFVAAGTYDPKYNSTYWTSLIMGLIAGTVIVELVPFQSMTQDTTLQNFGKPALAVLAGFSVNMIYNMLQHIVNTLEAFVRGDRSDLKNAEITNKKIVLSHQNLQQTELIKLAQDLQEIRNNMHEQKDMDTADKGLHELIKKVTRQE